MSATMKQRTGFTIVELLIVVVVIAILATISTVAYQSIARRAKESVVRQDMENAHKEIGMFQATGGSLPLADNCPSPAVTEICLKGSPGTIFTYLPNDPVAPTSYQLLATNGEISFVAKDGSSPESSYGSRFITLTNMVQNGDFSAGATGWSTTYCWGSSICQVSGGMLKMISDETARISTSQLIAGPYTDGDKIFYSARVRKNSGSGFSMNVQRNGGGYNKVIMTTAQFNAAASGSFGRYSDIRNFVASQGTGTVLIMNINSTSPSSAFDVDIDDAVVINLTSSFGAGNEPTVAQMDGILSQFSNGYFSGTVTATY